MPKPNSLIQIGKKLASLQAKSVKFNEDLKALADIVDAEAKKLEAAPVPAKVAPAKTAPAKAVKPAEAPKKQGRPAKK